MAVVKHQCGNCGSEVQLGAVQCPRCAQPLEWGGADAAAVKCIVCGYRNVPVATLCASCGAQLSGAASIPAQGPGRKKVTAKRTAPVESGGKRVEPWQIISVVAVVGLIVLFVVMELSREHSPTLTSSAPLSVPPFQSQSPARVDLAPLEQAVATRPSDSDALLKLANGLHDNGSYDRAIETYKKYLALQPSDPNARVDLGICYYEIGVRDTINPMAEFALALQEMKAVYKRSPTHQAAAFNLGIVNLHMGNMEESKSWFRKAADLDKSSTLGQKAQQMLTQHSFSQ